MPAPPIVLPYNPATGDALDPVQLNEDLQVVHDTANGWLNTSSFDAAFLARRQHIRPGQAISPQSVGFRGTTHIYDNVCAKAEDFSNAHILPGCSITWYQRFPARICLVNFGWWGSCWNLGPTAAVPGIPSHSVATKLYVDGTGIDHTRRAMPKTVWQIPTGVYDNFFIQEHHSTRLRAEHHLIENLTVGWHTVDVRAFLETLEIPVLADRYGTKEPPTQTYLVPARLRVGVRNLTVLPVI